MIYTIALIAFLNRRTSGIVRKLDLTTEMKKKIDNYFDFYSICKLTICYNSESPVVIHVDNVAVDHELVTLANCRCFQLRLALLERNLYFIIIIISCIAPHPAHTCKRIRDSSLYRSIQKNVKCNTICTAFAIDVSVYQSWEKNKNKINKCLRSLCETTESLSIPLDLKSTCTRACTLWLYVL